MLGTRCLSGFPLHKFRNRQVGTKMLIGRIAAIPSLHSHNHGGENMGNVKSREEYEFGVHKHERFIGEEPTGPCAREAGHRLEGGQLRCKIKARTGIVAKRHEERSTPMFQRTDVERERSERSHYEFRLDPSRRSRS